jgi:protein gp37
VRWGNFPRKRTTEAYWKAPPIWNAQHKAFVAAHGHRQRVFCASLADVFDNQAPKKWRDDLFTLIRDCPNLDWLLLTKRPQNVRKMLPSNWESGYANVWLGMTAEDQERYDQRWKHLAGVPAAIRFVSYEPAIGPLRLRASTVSPDWVIIGGESGPGARPMSQTWVHAAIDDCRQLGIAPFFKQWGSWANNPTSRECRSTEEQQRLDPHGKGGGLIRGELIRHFPTPHSQPQRTAAAA